MIAGPIMGMIAKALSMTLALAISSVLISMPVWFYGLLRKQVTPEKFPE